MQHVSKKLIRVTIMDALEHVLNDRIKRVSKHTKMTIIEAVEKIAESLDQDFNDQTTFRKPKTTTLKRKKERRQTLKAK